MTQRYNVDNVQCVTVGFNGENNARSVEFDISQWRKEYPNIGVYVMAVRPSETQPYAAVVQQSDNTLTWQFAAYDTAKTGYGRAILYGLVDDVRVKTAIFSLHVCDSIDTTSAIEPTPPEQAWLDEVLLMLTATREARDVAIEQAQNASDSADIASSKADIATSAAQSASASEQNAIDSADRAEAKADIATEAMSNALQYAQEAEQSANDAEQSAQGIQNMTVSSNTLQPGSPATVEKTANPQGIVNLNFGLPKGEKGDKGNVQFATFEIELSTGNLIMTTTDEYDYIDFNINNEGFLEVAING